MNEKQSLRLSAGARREGLTRACPDFADRIASYADDLPVPTGAVVSFFWPMGDEADPRALASAFAARGHVLALPVVVAPRAPLIFRRWRVGDALVAHKFGMNEPTDTAPELRPDVLLTPLLAFDAQGYRLGFGAGFYDRTLDGLRATGKVLAVGVAYAGQEVEAVPREPHDHRLDMIVTEHGVRQLR